MRSPARTIPSSWHSEIRARSFDTADRRHSQTFKFGILFLFTVGLFWYAGVEACFRPMWSDEVFTLKLTQISGGSAFWTAFFSGGECNPPFYFVTARAVSQLIGSSSFALRLPSLLGFWLMCMALYGFVARRCNLAFAWAAMILPTCTFAMRYAYDARPYGLWLGLSAVALFCWQGATIHHRRLLDLMGLAGCLGLTIWTHFYSVLFFIPLGLAELVRTRSRRRVDVGIWTAFALGLSPILGLTGLIQRNAQFSENFWAKPKWFRIVDTYAWLFEPAVVPLIAALTLILWMTIRNYHAEIEGKENTPIDAPLVPAHELVAVTGLVAMSLITMVLAKLATNAYELRYALPTVIGCDLLIVLSVAILTRYRPAVGVSLSLILGGWFACVGNHQAESLEH
jgi:Dolichyl-phosphate-mannose-protein mannosyltransferase